MSTKLGGRKMLAFLLSLAAGVWLAHTGIQAGASLMELATLIGAVTSAPLAIYSGFNVQAKKVANGHASPGG